MRYLGLAAIFVSGVGIGVACTFGYFKTKYESYAQEEIEEVRKYYKEKDISEHPDKKVEFVQPSKEELDKYKTIVNRTNYNSMAKDPKKIEGKEVDEVVDKNFPKDDPPNSPYVIDENEFEEFDPYFEKVVLSYYTEDGVLADDQDEMVDDLDGTIGRENYETFVTDRLDTMYIRNPNLSVDYEIDRVVASYRDNVGGGY